MDINPWSKCIDELRSWLQRLPNWEDYIQPPSENTIHKAIFYAYIFRDTSFLVPTRVLPGGEGDIVFEGRNESELEFWSVTVDKDGEVFFDLFRDNDLVKCVEYGDGVLEPYEWQQGEPYFTRGT